MYYLFWSVQTAAACIRIMIYSTFFWGGGRGNTGRFSNVYIFSLQEKTLNLDDSRNWVVGIMVSTTIVKFLLMVYCRTFSNEIVRAYAQDHFFDVVTNLIGLIAAILASIFFWWIDPAGAIVVCYLTFNLPYHDSCSRLDYHLDYTRFGKTLFNQLCISYGNYSVLKIT